MTAIWPTLATLSVALGGAALAALFALPAGPLIGALIAVAVASALGLKTQVPTLLRDGAFLLIGVSLGAGIDAGVLAQLPDWSVSLLVLALSLVATVALSSWLLQRFYGLDRDTAVLASAPGTRSNVVAIAAEGRGDATTVMILQLVRLVLLVTCVPPVTVLINLPDVAAMTPRATMALPALIVLVALGLPLGRGLSRLGVPAACLLTGLVLSAGAHASDLLQGSAAPWLVFVAFSITGAVIGTRIAGVSPKAALRLAGAGVTVVLTVMALSLVFALLTRALTGLPLGMVLVAYAPGGVEAMAVIGLSLGYDPAYIAAHHFARILLLVGLVPLFMKRRSPGN
jgi:membrane AbrB-like protein